jgi:hypothetical protein
MPRVAVAKTLRPSCAVFMVVARLSQDTAVTPARDPFRSRNVKRFACVPHASGIPPPMPGVPEVAIAGRSNVGKSTLLNLLLGIRSRRGAAAVGDKPGVTQSLDFYRLGPRDR